MAMSEAGETKGQGKGKGKGGAAAKGGTEVRSNGPAAVTKNNPEVRAAAVHYLAKLGEAKDRRGEVNADIKALREGMVARGLNKQAIKDIERYHGMTETQRAGYDESIAILRAAIGEPLQAELFRSVAETALAEDGPTPPASTSH